MCAALFLTIIRTHAPTSAAQFFAITQMQLRKQLLLQLKLENFEGYDRSGWEKPVNVIWVRSLDHIDSFMLCNLTNINKLGQRNNDRTGGRILAWQQETERQRQRQRRMYMETKENAEPETKANRSEAKDVSQRKRKSQVFALAFVAASRFHAFRAFRTFRTFRAFLSPLPAAGV